MGASRGHWDASTWRRERSPTWDCSVHTHSTATYTTASSEKNPKTWPRNCCALAREGFSKAGRRSPEAARYKPHRPPQRSRAGGANPAASLRGAEFAPSRRHLQLLRPALETPPPTRRHPVFQTRGRAVCHRHGPQAWRQGSYPPARSDSAAGLCVEAPGCRGEARAPCPSRSARSVQGARGLPDASLRGCCCPRGVLSGTETGRGRLHGGLHALRQQVGAICSLFRVGFHLRALLLCASRCPNLPGPEASPHVWRRVSRLGLWFCVWSLRFSSQPPGGHLRVA